MHALTYYAFMYVAAMSTDWDCAETHLGGGGMSAFARVTTTGPSLAVYDIT